jgi:hypothetical protein
MSAGESSVKIRLEISVPIGAGVEMNCESGQKGGARQEYLHALKAVGGNDVILNMGDVLCVTPGASSSLGAVAIGFDYGSAPINEVQALVVPICLDTGAFGNNPPLNAKPADSSGSGIFRWNSLGMSDHLPAGPFPQNHVHLWCRTGSNWTKDGSTLFTFAGCTQGSGACLGGSGSGVSGSGVSGSAGAFMKELDLVVEILVDRKLRKYHAEALQGGLWKFKAGGTEWTIHRHGGIMVMTNGKDVGLAIHHGADPVHAVFPRHILHADADIKVYEKS